MLDSKLRFRTARDHADEMGQVFTPTYIAKLLLSTIDEDFDFVVDVGAGTGVLAAAARVRNQGAKLILIEKDKEYIGELSRFFLEDVVIDGDVISSDVFNNLSFKSSRALFVSNPPYGMVRLNESILTNFEPCSYINKGGWVRKDVVFLSKIWLEMEVGAKFGFIIAAPIISSPSYQKFRENILQSATKLVVTELNCKTFSKAEVHSYLITGVKKYNDEDDVTLRQTDKLGIILNEVKIKKYKGINRLDFSYHSLLKKMQLDNRIILGTLASLGGTIVRGRLSSKECKSLGLEAFHTTSFLENTKEIKLWKISSIPCKYKAMKGDILLPRVGTRCLDKEGIVIEGEGIITDCIYRIRLPTEELRDAVWETINSDFGRQWRRLMAQGSCAKYLTLTALGELPILM